MITANELKIKGIKAIEKGLKENKEVAISVRGKAKYVAMTIEQFEFMRQNELDLTYSQVMNDIKEGKYHTSLERHFSEIDEAIKNA
ncbi:MAG: prevent-host-death protein [Saprospiraceae bacterium]